MSAVPPASRPACPLCGEPNACAVAAQGRFDVRCWCADLALPPAARTALASAAGVPPACACAACLQRLGARPTGRAA